jgi:hypothetical protein
MVMYSDNVQQFLFSFSVPSTFNVIFMDAHQTPAWNETENVVKEKEFRRRQMETTSGAFWHALGSSIVLVLLGLHDVKIQSSAQSKAFRMK